MKKILQALTVTTALACCGSNAFADNTMNNMSVSQSPANTNQNTPVMLYLKNIGASLAYVKTEAGLPGYMSDIKGHRTMIYLLPDGEHFLVGSMLNSQGKNLTLTAASEEESKLTEALRQLKERASANAGDLGISQSSNSSNPLPISNTPNNAVNVGMPNFDNNSPLPSTPEASVSAVENNGQSVVIPTSINQDVSTGFINSKINSSELSKDILKTAYFEEYHEKGSPVVYFVADPQCPYCHQAWDMLSTLMKKHKFSVNVILSDALPGSDRMVTQLLGNQNIVQLWNQGVGSKDGIPIPESLKVGSENWRTSDMYRLNNNKFASKYNQLIRKNNSNSNGVPILMYVGKDGKVRAEEGVYTGADKLDAMKAFLSGLPGWNAADSDSSK